MRGAASAISLFAVLLLLTASTGDFVGFDIIELGSRTNLEWPQGCMPMEFSGSAGPKFWNAEPKRTQQAVLALADPPSLCRYPRNAAELKGKVVVGKRGDCMFDLKAKAAFQAGAVGLIIVNEYDYQVPFSGRSGTDADLLPDFVKEGFPVCLAWADVWDTVHPALSDNEKVVVDFQSYSVTEAASKVVRPIHPVTTMRLIGPHELCNSASWHKLNCPIDFPVGQAVFNPSQYPAKSATLVKAAISAKCVIRNGPADAQACAACWNMNTVFDNAASMKGNVVTFSSSKGAGHGKGQVCFSNYYEFHWRAMEAGAAAVLWINTFQHLSTFVPQAVPFSNTIPMFNTYAGVGDWLLNSSTTHGDAITLRTPAISAGSGQNFYAPTFQTGLEDTYLMVGSVKVRAGQGSFNPPTAKTVGSSMRKLTVKPVCGDTKSCGLCFADANANPFNARSAASWATCVAGANGCVALVDAVDADCLPWADYSHWAKKLGAIAVVIRFPSGEPTQTLKVLKGHHTGAAKDPKSDIPIFNVNEDGVAGSGPWVVGLPAITTAKPPATGTTGPPFDVKSLVEEKLPATEIALLQPSALTAMTSSCDVGQAEFTPDSLSLGRRTAFIAVADLEACTWNGTTTLAEACGTCDNMLRTVGLKPAKYSPGIQHNVLLFDYKVSDCLDPETVVYYAQKAGAAGVLVNMGGDTVSSIGPSSVSFTVTIPTFVLTAGCTEDLTEYFVDGVKIQMPHLSAGVAPADPFQESDEADVLDESCGDDSNDLKLCRSNGAKRAGCSIRDGEVRCACPPGFELSFMGNTCESTKCTLREDVDCDNSVNIDGFEAAVQCYYNTEAEEKQCRCPAGWTAMTGGAMKCVPGASAVAELQRELQTAQDEQGAVAPWMWAVGGAVLLAALLLFVVVRRQRKMIQAHPGLAQLNVGLFTAPTADQVAMAAQQSMVSTMEEQGGGGGDLQMDEYSIQQGGGGGGGGGGGRGAQSSPKGRDKALDGAMNGDDPWD